MSWLGNLFGGDQTTTPVTTQSLVSPLGSAASLTPKSLGSAASLASNGEKYSVGEVVEYYSASQGSWIPAKVLAATPKGTYNLDCKPDVPVDKIRRRSESPAGSAARLGAGDGVKHKVGDIVEYYSTTQNGWIPAKVLSVNPKGTYNLDCKPEVLPDKIRRHEKRGRSPSGGYGASPRFRARSMGSRDSAGPPPELSNPVQLLRVVRDGTRWRYEVCSEGAEVLEWYGSRRIAVATICGLYRTGKSYLLNLLLERVQKSLPLFQVGSTTQACTEGLWLWGSVNSDDDQSPLLAFIDCEGFGSTDSDRTRDAQLMTLCALLSSVLMLNTKGALNENLFNALALTCKFAEHIEENGNEASRPSLLWILRDFMLELRDSTGSAVTPDEYLEQALHSAPSMGHDQERGQSAREVRQGLLKFFSHRNCSTLVQPVIEESQLQQLDRVSYTSLRSEFRAGVEALRAQLVTLCNSNPKTIGGQPIGCYAFVGLMRQLVSALNDSKMLSMKGAWDSVQHSACNSLADELRGRASQVLRGLGTGQKIPTGAQLPMTDEGLRVAIREQRHLLKAQWDERAVGDEPVRKEYWQELKETLARDEAAVRQQNLRLADQQLTEMLRGWQEWLDNDTGSAAAGEKLSKDLGELMERMPAAPLSRAGRAAIEAAARRVAAVRTAVTATVEQSAEAQRRAVAWGEQAAKEEGAARSELDTKQYQLQETNEKHKALVHAEQTARIELQNKNAELQEAKMQLQAALNDIEDARSRESELLAQLRVLSSKGSTLQAELQEARALAAKAEAERNASDRCSRAASDAAAAEQERLEAELQMVRVETERIAEQLASERAVLKRTNEVEKARAVEMVEAERRKMDEERNNIKGEHEQTRQEQARMVIEARRQLEDERNAHTSQLEGEQARLLAKERSAGVMEGQVSALTGEASNLRDRIAELQVQVREAEVKMGQQRQANERLRWDLEKANANVEKTRDEIDTAIQQQHDEYERKIHEQELQAKKRFGCASFRTKPTSKVA